MTREVVSGHLWLSSVVTLQLGVTLTIFSAPLCCPSFQSTLYLHFDRILVWLHNAIVSTDFLLLVKPWSAKSPDLSPIEQVWDLINKVSQTIQGSANLTP